MLILWFSVVFCTSLFIRCSDGFGPHAKLFFRTDKCVSRRSTIDDADPIVSSKEGRGYFIPPDQIDKLKQSVDLVSVIESYNLPEFKRMGDRAKCICPFHDDNNPSLSIDGGRGIFKCFSCGAGGNVFSFVREYSKLRGDEMSFYRAVRLVNDRYATGFSLNLADGSFGRSTKSMEAYMIQETKKQRILLANLAAAAYFEHNLVSLPAAGAARSHLRTRGMNPSTVRAFTMGYAPDCYFQRKSYGPNGWGEGSLVHYLRDMNFTAHEIFDAGLATRTKAKTKAQGTVSDTSSADAEIEFTNLMDRFRGRIVIPILDANGKNVLGFGGRILNDVETSGFKAAKYLNSPESLVFKKQNILYGQHMAKKSLRYWADQGRDKSLPLVVVEGYMDAIGLWQIGVREAVASMGTALTQNQLEAAAAIAGTRNGRIVLCLDNDDAGRKAVERLCTGSILSSIVERFPLEILIASLPNDIKDPADFVELIKDSSNPEERFRAEIVSKAVEWSDWYIKHILSSYDDQSIRGTRGSFGDIFERLASFLATYKNAAERTKRACEVAASLGDILSDDANATQASNTVRVQLETDLVEKAASIANSNAAIANRIAPSGTNDNDVKTKMYNVASGYGSLGIEEASKMSKGALNRASKAEVDNATTSAASTRPRSPPPDERRSLQGTRFRMGRLPVKQEPTLTPHFSGFDFLSENDAKWLGLVDDKGKKRNDGLMPKSALNQFGEINDLKQKKPVYFNSNEYHGNQFLTQEAISAGYKDKAIDRDSGIFERGVASLLQLHDNEASVAAEESLLRMLLLFSSARKALKTSIGISYASGSNDSVEWSSPVRRWLFSCLVEQEATLPQDIIGPMHLTMLQTYLATRPDMPLGAIGSVSEEIDSGHDITVPTASDTDGASNGTIAIERGRNGINLSKPENDTTPVMDDSSNSTVASASSAMNVEKHTTENTSNSATNGDLDHLFDDALQFVGNISLRVDANEKFELSAQQAYSTLLLGSARKRLSRIHHQLTTAIMLLHQSSENDEAGAPKDERKTDNEVFDASLSLEFFNKTVTRTELEDLCMNMTTTVQDCVQKVNSLAASNDRLTKGLTNIVLSSGLADGDISKTECTQLSKRLQEEMQEIMALEKWSQVEEENEEDEPYEDTLERAQLEWGELFEDGRMWSPDDAGSQALREAVDGDLSDRSHLVMDAAADDKESIDDFLSRVDSEWGWVDGMDGDLDDDLTKSTH